MGAIALLFLGETMKKENSLMSMEEILSYGIKDWDILERRVFNHYKVKL